MPLNPGAAAACAVPVPVRALRGHRGQVKELELSPDSSRLYSLSEDSTVRLSPPVRTLVVLTFGNAYLRAKLACYQPSTLLCSL